LRIATIAIVAQQDSLVFLGYRDAMVVPARRASAVDPLIALRQ
jgi:hypothetical protein